MKRILSLVLSLCLVLGLCACGGKTETPAGEGLSWQEQYDLGIRYLSEGNYQEAIIAFTAAIEIDPKRPEAFVGRGDAYVGTAQLAVGESAELPEEGRTAYESAAADYLSAIGLDKLLAAVYGKAADVYLALGDIEAAAAILEQGYEATGDEELRTRAEALRTVPSELPKGSIVVTMYEMADGAAMFVGHDAYAFDSGGRMTANVWYDTDNSILYSETWVYDDAAGETHLSRVETEYDETSDEEEVVHTEETIPGCEDQGWYWEDMNEFLTDPTMESVNGRVALDDGRYAVYGFDGQGRVSAIHTYGADGGLLGYCIVTYTT